jgi:hypothetical protein
MEFPFYNLLIMNDTELLKILNYNLTCNQTPTIIGEKVTINIYRGSQIRGNRVKVFELHFAKSHILNSIELDSLTDLIADAESKLNIPLVADKTVW